jgi:hypothetical protein
MQTGWRFLQDCAAFDFLIVGKEFLNTEKLLDKAAIILYNLLIPRDIKFTLQEVELWQ